MVLRQNKFLQEKDYTENIAFCRKMMAKAFDDEMIASECKKVGERRRIFHYYQAYNSAFKMLRYRYIQGDDLASLREDCERLLTHMALLNTERERIKGSDIQDNSITTIWSIGFFISLLTALDFPEARIVSFVKEVPLVRNYRVESRFVQRYDSKQTLDDTFANSDQKKCFAIIEAAPDKRPGLIIKYLDRLAAGHVKNPYSMSHEGPSWYGYWDYAISGIVTAFNVDDSSFIDHEYYPTDLMRPIGAKRGAPIVLPPLESNPSDNVLPAPPVKVAKRVKAPKALAAHQGLYDLITSTLAPTLQDLLWNALVKWLKTPEAKDEELDVNDIDDFMMALCLAQENINLKATYKRDPLLHCDHKDIDSAEACCIDMAITAGLGEYEPDQLEQAGVGTWYALQRFDQWLAQHHYSLIVPLDGHDSYCGFIAPNDLRAETVTVLAKFGLEIESFG